MSKGEKLERVENMNGHFSPRLGIRFELQRGNIAVYHPDGRRFLSYVELGTLQHETQTRAETAEQHAADERQRAEQERRHAEEARQKAERLAARLRELGVDPDVV